MSSFNTLKNDIRDAISLQVCNIYDKKAVAALGKFDVIFSRNMLIYFDDASKYEVAMTFFDMLNVGGYILLGHTEYMSRITPVFEAKKIGQHLVYQKPAR
jgi:chemotaxis protein methyltransferase CheR